MKDEEQISLKEAVRLSLIKWEILAKEDERTYSQKYHEISHHPELMGISNNCGFCERHSIESVEVHDLDCHSCELGKIMGGICKSSNSLYHLWNNYHKRSTEAAQKLVDVIKSIKIED